MPSFVKKFPAKGIVLSPAEKRILVLLTKAAELIAVLYERQRNPRYPGANLYPSNVSREDLEKAAKRHPEILSPYTFVERDSSGELFTVPYRVKFQKELRTIAALLKQAAPISQDQNFKAYLKARAEDLLIDNFDRSNILWLKTEKSRIGFIIGPFDRYIDKLFFRKRAYMAWIGILDAEETKELDQFKAKLLVSERKYLPGAKRVKVSQVKLRVEDTLLFSGLTAEFLFTGNTLPSSADLHLHKKYGSIFTVFKPIVHARFSGWIRPIFQKFFSLDLQKKYSQNELEAMFLTSVIVHHACHSLIRYRDAVTRLSGLFPYFDELYTDLLGVKGCGSLLLKGGFTNKEMEILLLTTVCHGLFYYGAMRTMPHQVEQFTQGHAILLKFLLDGHALEKQKRGFHMDFHRTFMAISQLASIVEYYMALGNANEASEFLKKFSIPKTFGDLKRYIPRGTP